MNTIEIRWFVKEVGPYQNYISYKLKILQYRQLLTGQWTDWKDVPTIEE